MATRALNCTAACCPCLLSLWLAKESSFWVSSCLSCLPSLMSQHCPLSPLVAILPNCQLSLPKATQGLGDALVIILERCSL